mmetsp:Transcript_70428/g.165812  ORF Transcript_70428/g.165812 Transcript_70428/m.165812 type:complete len:394 (-) Transcript_70428:1359-2540(-)
MKSCGGRAASASSKGRTTTWSTPQRSSSTSLSRSVAMRAGASSGLPAWAAKKSRGCGSKVSTQLVRPRWRASDCSSASMAWWPRCTPSKLPMVSAQAGATPGWWKPLNTRIGRIVPAASVAPDLGGARHPAPATRREVGGQGQRAELRAVQGLDPVAHGRHHALDLVVLALDQRQPQQGLVDDLGAVRLGDFGRALELAFGLAEFDTRQQLLDHRGRQRMLATGLIDLGHMVLGRGELVDERPVICQQQQAGSVLIQPADGLHAPLAERCRQQAHHARMVLGFLRALVAGRLVQQDQGLVEAGPFLAADREAQARGLELGVGVIDRLAVHGDLVVPHQAGAQAPRAEALAEQDLRQPLLHLTWDFIGWISPQSAPSQRPSPETFMVSDLPWRS